MCGGGSHEALRADTMAQRQLLMPRQWSMLSESLQKSIKNEYY
jgi:hypothetical protein